MTVRDESDSPLRPEQSNGARPPRSFWREVPCGHPPDPVAWVAPVTDPVCHCGAVLDLGRAMFDLDLPDEIESVVPCDRCGCAVGIPADQGVSYPKGFRFGAAYFGGGYR